MTTTFSYETVFEAASRSVVLASYFDPDHLAAQDAVGDLCDRTVVASREDERVRSCTWRVRSAKSLPLYVRPFLEGGHVDYAESMTWRKADDEIDLSIKPQILGGRIQIAAVYQISDIGPRQVRRRYRGTITADVKLISRKIERAIAAEIEKGMPVMTECTRTWLAQRG